MTDGAATKVCPLCAETIKVAAKVCPFCQSRLSRFALWQRELALAAPLVLLAGFALAIFAWVIPDEAGSLGGRLRPHRDDLIVQRTSLGSAAKRPDYWLSGFVSNRSAHPWRIWQLEVRFLNRDGSLLDVQHPNVGDAFVVQPARECAFRIGLGRLPPAVGLASVTARVDRATDGNLALEPD